MKFKDLYSELYSFLSFFLFLVPCSFVWSFPLLKKMALDWMLFREKSSHCAGGILADQQVISDFQAYSH